MPNLLVFKGHTSHLGEERKMHLWFSVPHVNITTFSHVYISPPTDCRPGLKLAHNPLPFTIFRVFLECHFTNWILKYLCRIFKYLCYETFTIPATWQQLLTFFNSGNLNYLKSGVFVLISQTCFYMIWKEKNNRRHNQWPTHPHAIAENCKRLVFF